MNKSLCVTLVMAYSLAAAVSQNTAKPVSSDDCESNRERCMESCEKQHKDCDARANSEEQRKWCQQSDEQCSNGCNEAWRKCQENKKGAVNMHLASDRVLLTPVSHEECNAVCTYQGKSGRKYIGISSSDCDSACDDAFNKCSSDNDTPCTKIRCTATNCH